MNQSIVLWLNHWANSSLYASNLTIFGAVYLPWAMFFGLGFFIYGARRRFRALRIALLAVASGLLALFVADLVKDMYPVARPFAALKGVLALFKPGDLAAFPSSHAAFFGGLAFYMFLKSRRTGVWYLLIAILVGLTRIAAGVHFPLDILAGWGLAFLSSWLFLRLGRFLSV